METEEQRALYARCRIKYIDDNSIAEVIIKLSEEVEDNDDIFYYCDSIKELFTAGTSSDFIVTDVLEYIGNRA
ncbi:MAG: hypothetical protein SNG27_07350 [Rikenellaceae bacterium]